MGTNATDGWMTIADYYSGLGIGSIADNPGVSFLRQVLKIDPETLRAIGEQYVCHRTPTPEGFLDVWDYCALLKSVKDTYKFRLDV